MDDESKRKLDDIFKQTAALKERAEKKRDLEGEAQAAFLAQYLKCRAEVIEPAMKEFADYIKPHGWNVDIDNQEDTPARLGLGGKVDQRALAAGVRMTFYQGSERPYVTQGRTLPSFSANCDKQSRTVSFFESTMGPTHGGSSGGTGAVPLDQVTALALHERLVKYFTKLAENARPYSER